MEIWKDIPGYEGIYQASTMGQIRTKPGKKTKRSDNEVRTWNTRVLKPRGANYKTGYRVSLWKDGKSKDWLICRLVAMTFLGIPNEKLTVNHKDGNRLNNNISNLEWLSLSENIRHGFNNGLYPTQQGITLISEEGSIHIFRSLSQAGHFLGKSHGYVSGRLKKNQDITDVNNIKYTVI